MRRPYRPVPAAPASCKGLAWGDAFRLRPTGRAALYCHGDTAFSVDAPPALAAGDSWRGQGIACTATRTALTCRNRSGHGFALARASFRLF